jgi:hypothetical protein
MVLCRLLTYERIYILALEVKLLCPTKKNLIDIDYSNFSFDYILNQSTVLLISVQRSIVRCTDFFRLIRSLVNINPPKGYTCWYA